MNGRGNVEDEWRKLRVWAWELEMLAQDLCRREIDLIDLEGEQGHKRHLEEQDRSELLRRLEAVEVMKSELLERNAALDRKEKMEEDRARERSREVEAQSVELGQQRADVCRREGELRVKEEELAAQAESLSSTEKRLLELQTRLLEAQDMAEKELCRREEEVRSREVLTEKEKSDLLGLKKRLEDMKDSLVELQQQVDQRSRVLEATKAEFEKAREEAVSTPQRYWHN